MNVKTVDTYNFVNSDVQSPIQQSIYNSLNSQNEFCGVIKPWTEAGLSDNEDYSVSNVTTIFDSDGKELKKLLNIDLGKENLVQLKIQINSANPISFFKKNVNHELNMRDLCQKILPVKQATKDFYCGFTDNAIKIIGKIELPIRSNG